ncbi:MAG: glycoside hydrolase family 10 protein [Candidatus Latescibacterota bacterium]
MIVQKRKGCRTRQSAPFSRIGGAVLVLFGILSCSVYSPAANIPEVRGLWVVRESLAGPEHVQQLVEFADAFHYNALFVQVRGRGDAFYQSALVPGPEEFSGIPSQFDPLAALIPLAHDRGMEVHAWFNIYLTWSSGTSPSAGNHVLRIHPDWFMVSLNGLSMATCPIDSAVNSVTEGRYLSPGLEPVRTYLLEVIREAVEKYRFDGVHLDYVRYPGWSFDFHESVRTDFKKQFGLDPRIAVTGERGADPQLLLLGKWVEFRAGQVSRFVREVSAQVRKVDPRVRISAAVKPDAEEAYHRFGQDWPQWLREGSVDFVVLMSYISHNGRFRDTLNSAIAKSDRRKIIGGVGAYMISPEAVGEQISYTRELGLLGYCTFSYGACRGNPLLEASLKKTVQAGKAVLPPDFKPYLRRGK